MHEVIAVEKGSLAARYGIVPGDFVTAINGEALIDDIDYQALTAVRRLTLSVVKEDGTPQEIEMLKRESSPLGLHFAQTLVCDPRSCANQCVFCFVDQMPTGMRKSLYIKDDDWRLSLMMGNFVTLTNVSDREFDRILRRKASPLYVSVHATDPAVRTAMMRQKRASQLMKRLDQLRSAGISFHCQVVLCPGLNDGEVLRRTLDDLYAMVPHALSVALVPVGLTKYREALTQLKPFDRQSALDVLYICNEFQVKALAEIGSRFAFPADELICIAQADVPPDDAYEGYPQMENGIGMIRAFETELSRAARQAPPTQDAAGAHILLACGTSILPYMRRWTELHAGPGMTVSVQGIRNRFFGETVTVSGLIVGQDLAQQLQGLSADVLLLPDNMLNADKTLFLDDMSPGDLEGLLGIPVRIIPPSGITFYAALQDPWPLVRKGIHHAQT